MIKGLSDMSKISNATTNLTLALLFASILLVGYILVYMDSPTAQTTLSSDDVIVIEQYVRDLERLNEINQELIQIYELRLLECSGDLHTS